MANPEPERHAFRPSVIAGRGFSLVKKGYEPEEVHDFLRDVAEYVSRLQGEVEWLRARSEHLERRTAAAQEAAYARVSRDFMEVVRRADEAAGRVRLQAETKAQADLMMAHKEAERLLNEARSGAEKILAAARLEAHEIEWQSVGRETGQGKHPENEWPGTADVPSSDVPTAAMDIAAIWELDDEGAPVERATAPPRLFEDLSSQAIHIPEAWTSNSQVLGPEFSNEPTRSEDPEDLHISLDVSIFDLFENPDD